MNVYITDALQRIASELSCKLSPERIDELWGELEMMKLEIEQHISNMPSSHSHATVRDAAEQAVEKLSQALELAFELPQDASLAEEMIILLEDIEY